MVIVQADRFTDSRLRTVIAVALTSNLRLAAMPGNVLLTRTHTGLEEDSVANVTQVATLDEGNLIERVGDLPLPLSRTIDDGLRLVLSL